MLPTLETERQEHTGDQIPLEGIYRIDTSLTDPSDRYLRGLSYSAGMTVRGHSIQKAAKSELTYLRPLRRQK